MRRDLHTRLDRAFTSHRVIRQLHDVPPHEVYEVRVDGRRAVYKGTTGPTGNAGTEGRVIAFVGERTSVPVPEILWTGDDHFVAAWHPDAPAPDGGQSGCEQWATAAGRGLATLHTETAPWLEGHGQFRAENGGLAFPGHADWHGAAIEYIRLRRQVLARYGQADIAETVIDFLNDRPAAFDEVDGPVCCHGWATPEHVSVTDEQVSCMVDFEHAIVAPGEFDYWRTVLPTFDHGTDGPAKAFRAGYESVRPLPTGFERRRPLYELLNWIYFFESLYVQDQHDPDETTRRAERLRERVLATLDTLR